MKNEKMKNEKMIRIEKEVVQMKKDLVLAKALKAASDKLRWTLELLVDGSISSDEANVLITEAHAEERKARIEWRTL